MPREGLGERLLSGDGRGPPSIPAVSGVSPTGPAIGGPA